MSINVQSFLQQLESGIGNLAKTTVNDFARQAAADGKRLLGTLKEDLVRRTKLLADGKITRAEFEILLLTEKDLVEMKSLTQAGLALAKIDEFKAGVFKLIIDTVTGLI